MLTQYIGKPYSFKKFNCWDFVALVRKDNGIKTKLFKVRNMDEAFETFTAQMAKVGSGLLRVESPGDFDVVVVTRTLKGRKTYHCGLYYNGDVAHCCNNFGAVRAESLAEFTKDYEGVTFWR